MNLIFIDLDLVRNASFFGHQILYLSDTLLVQKTVFRTERQTERHRYWVKITGNGNQRRVASHSSVHTTNTALLLSVRLQNGIASAPAEADSANFVGTRDLANGINEARDQRLRDAFAVLDQPRAKRCGNNGGVLGFVNDAGVLAVLERWLDVVQEGEGQRVAFVNIWNVAVEAGFGIVVGEKADIFELPAKDYTKRVIGRAMRFVRLASLLSTRKIMLFDVEPPWGSAM